MVDLGAQYKELKTEINSRMQEVLESSAYINGPAVRTFENNLSQFLQVDHVVSCGNGTDALQIALMALDLSPGDEVIIPSFTYVATAEVIALLGLKPVMVDADYDTFNIDCKQLETVITSRSKVIIPVHLFGQCCDMDKIMQIANQHNLYVIEDNAQSIGAEYSFDNGTKAKAGTIGHIGCTSFYPSKNLGAYGDGGAIMTKDESLAYKIRRIANHGQSKKYHHDLVGVNSRLDSLQACVLDAKLMRLKKYNAQRADLAMHYSKELESLEQIIVPSLFTKSEHVYHQYTLKVLGGKRDELKEHLNNNGIPSMIYYPIPLYAQDAYKQYHAGTVQETTERLCKEVLSLPMHPNMTRDQADFITSKIKSFYS